MSVLELVFTQIELLQNAVLILAAGVVKDLHQLSESGVGETKIVLSQID